MTLHKTAVVDGLSVFYREAGKPEAPKLVLLGGFPASSHQFRNLIPALTSRFHVIAPDYPGFGNTEMPDPGKFPYTFDRLSEIVEGLLSKTGFTRAGFFMQDYGGPIGFRILERRPEWMEWLILQNTNAYEEGFTAAWDGIRHALWKNPGPQTETPLLPFLDLEGIKLVYQHGHTDPEHVSPDNWQMDFRFMERPNARRVQLDLFYDYRTNIPLYPLWQTYFRKHQPPTLVVWGRNDAIFVAAGAAPYRRDIPEAEIHLLHTGHFALETHGHEIAKLMREFLGRTLKAGG
jgi:pimeloyl-ACP methyl ester carboxylesterase